MNLKTLDDLREVQVDSTEMVSRPDTLQSDSQQSSPQQADALRPDPLQFVIPSILSDCQDNPEAFLEETEVPFGGE